MSRRALVVGLGASGRAAATALRADGWTVRAADEDAALDPDGLPEGVEVVLGEVGPALLADVDLVVPSPGVAPARPVLAAATEAGLPVWSEPELAWRLAGGRTRLLAVTGTNGKTTTTEMLAACTGAPTAGNIGRPLVEALTDTPAPPLVVAELSSFQLHFCHELRPDVAVLVNIAADHWDWHGGADGYLADKARIWQAQGPADTTVVNAADPTAMSAVEAFPPPGQTLEVTPEDPLLDGLTLRAAGPHNHTNALLAGRAALAAGTPEDQVREALAGYSAGPHRLEVVAVRDGVTWVDDSKATNPHAALAALRSFDDVVWIAGGLNKGLSFDELAPALPDRVRLVLTIGRCGPEVAAMARAAGVVVEEVGDLDAAVPRAAEVARPGTTVLLAPAAASMDQFSNYAERGRTFRRLVGGAA